MAFVVTDKCIKDFRCVDECGMGAIAPGRDDPQAGEASQVYINPDACVECGACAMACDNDAIHADYMLPAEKAHFAEKNAAYFK